MNVQKLCLSLACCEKETEVIELLKQNNLWDDVNAWHNYGDNENNFSTIGNQLSWPGFFGQRTGVYKCKAALG